MLGFNNAGITLPNTGFARQGAELAELVIRRLAAADWAAFREVRLAALRDAPNAFGSTASEAEKLDEQEWRRRLEERAVFLAAFLADASTQRIGLAAGIMADQPGDAELVSMWVAPAWRGHGVGDRLVDAVLAWAKGEGLTNVGLWVAQDNTPAERLYARHGFARTGRVRSMVAGVADRPEFEMRRSVG
jgi:ribosomal protein S18 acetylase RimI-like enzyme